MNGRAFHKSVIVIDDEPDILFVLRTALERAGYQVDEASNGLEALEKINLHQPDAIILDLMMPKLDGHSVNLRLKENPATARIPVIIITGKGHLRELLDIREDLKVAAYLEKPFQVVTLLGKLEDIFRHQ